MDQGSDDGRPGLDFFSHCGRAQDAIMGMGSEKEGKVVSRRWVKKEPEV
jgi:hypothetical protein